MTFGYQANHSPPLPSPQLPPLPFPPSHLSAPPRVLPVQLAHQVLRRRDHLLRVLQFHVQLRRLRRRPLKLLLQRLHLAVHLAQRPAHLVHARLRLVQAPATHTQWRSDTFYDIQWHNNTWHILWHLLAQKLPTHSTTPIHQWQRHILSIHLDSNRWHILRHPFTSDSDTFYVIHWDSNRWHILRHPFTSDSDTFYDIHWDSNRWHILRHPFTSDSDTFYVIHWDSNRWHILRHPFTSDSDTFYVIHWDSNHRHKNSTAKASPHCPNTRKRWTKTRHFECSVTMHTEKVYMKATGKNKIK